MDYAFEPGSIPVLVSMPHVGTDIPDAIAARLAPCARPLADTDWHLRELYDFAGTMGASVLSARWSRYVIDLNRAPDDGNLYPGRDTTRLCPLDTFGGEALYLDGQAPGADEVQARLAAYWQPYHARLRAELERLLALHGSVVLWDAHSIASRVPRFFDGRLPDLNFGTADGAACAPGLSAALAREVAAQDRFSSVFDGRFKGGYITRRYGAPAAGVHAVQLEMAQCVYMDERAPFAYLPQAAAVQPLLRRLLESALAWVRE